MDTEPTERKQAGLWPVWGLVGKRPRPWSLGASERAAQAFGRKSLRLWTQLITGTLLTECLDTVVTKYHRLGGLSSASLLVLEAGSLRLGCQRGSGGALFWVVLLVVSSHGRRDEGALWGLLYEGMGLNHEGSTLVIYEVRQFIS